MHIKFILQLCPYYIHTDIHTNIHTDIHTDNHTDDIHNICFQNFQIPYL